MSSEGYSGRKMDRKTAIQVLIGMVKNSAEFGYGPDGPKLTADEHRKVVLMGLQSIYELGATPSEVLVATLEAPFMGLQGDDRDKLNALLNLLQSKLN